MRTLYKLYSWGLEILVQGGQDGNKRTRFKKEAYFFKMGT